MKRKIVYLSLTTLCFIACILIVVFFSGNHIIRGFIGDIIVISLIYFFIKTFYDFNAFKLTIFTLVVAYTTEFLQYLNLITFLGLEHNTIARVVLGSVFDFYDLAAYTIGAALVYIVDTKLVRKFIIDTKK